MLLTSTGAMVAPEYLPQTLSYDAEGRLSYIEVAAGTYAYRQTYTYDAAGQLQNISSWEPQQ